MQIHSLFPVPVAYVQERNPTKDELSFIKGLDTVPNNNNLTSQDTNVLNREELSGLRNIIQTHVDMFFRECLRANESCSLKITQSWCNYSKGDQYHHLHNHSNSAISGVYYPQADHPNDSLQFHTPLNIYQSALQYEAEPNQFTSGGCSLPASTGTLFLFPSYLYHSVDPIQERLTTRISLSFNTFFTGSIGSKRGLTELKFGE